MPPETITSAAPPPRWRDRSWWPAAVLGSAALLAYANSLRVPFVYDDVLAIPDNPSIRQLWPLTDVLLPSAAGGGLTIAGRPVLNLSFALNYAISGPAVWSYHLVNLLIHAGAGLLVFEIVMRTLPRWRAIARDRTRAIALTIAALWTLHPLHTQAVTYTVQRAESLMGLFYLLTLYGFIRATEPPIAAVAQQIDGLREPNRPRRWFALSLAACALGMGTKEVMASAPLLVLLYDRTFVGRSFAGAWRARGGYYLALASCWLLLAALLFSTGWNRGGTVGLGVGLPWWAYGLTQFKAVAHYLAKSLWPSPLVFEYGTWWVKQAGDIAPYAALVLPLIVASALALWRWPAAGFLGAWFFGILAPTSLAPGTIQMIVEHRMYLPLIALVTGGVLALKRIGVFRSSALALGIAAALGALTVRRNHDYRSALALWTDTVSKRPDNPRAHEGLAEAWDALGQHDRASAHRTEAIRLRPDEATYHYNLGLTLAQDGRLEEALQSYRAALRLAPGESRTHNNLAVTLAQLGRYDEAMPHYIEAVRLAPSEAQFHYNYGIALLRAGRKADAIEQYRTTLRLQPGHADAHYNLAAALARSDRLADALPHYAEAARLRPEDEEHGRTLGDALLAVGKPADAEKEFRRVVARKPEAIEARLGLATALAALRKHPEALAEFRTVLTRAPSHGEAHYRFANLLIDLEQPAEAVRHYERAIQSLPKHAEAQHNLGVAFAQLERWTDAQRAFEMALQLKPDYPEARRNLEQLQGLLRGRAGATP